MFVGIIEVLDDLLNRAISSFYKNFQSFHVHNDALRTIVNIVASSSSVGIGMYRLIKLDLYRGIKKDEEETHGKDAKINHI